jgi:hypothetical protein
LGAVPVCVLLRKNSRNCVAVHSITKILLLIYDLWGEQWAHWWLQFRDIVLPCWHEQRQGYMRFQVLTAASMMFRFVFWDVLRCKIIVDRRFRGAYWLPWWWRQYAPLKRQSTIILHGSTSQKTSLNMGIDWIQLPCGMIWW